MLPCQKRTVAQILVVLSLATHIGLVAWLGANQSPNIDELAHLAGGMAMWQYGKLDVYVVNPPLVRGVAALPATLMPHEPAWGDFDRVPQPRPEFVLGEQFVDSHPLNWRRFLIAGRWALLPFSVVGGLFCYFWAADLCGRKAGLMALALWCFSPNVLTWSSLIGTDMPAAAMSVGAGYFFWRWLQQPTWGRATLAGVLLGLAQLCKMTCLALFVVWPALWLFWRSRDARNRAERPQFVKLAAILLIGLYVLNLGYAFDGSFTLLGEFDFRSSLLAGEGSSGAETPHGNQFRGSVLHWLPVPLPVEHVRGMDLQRADFEEGEPSYLFGEWSERGFWYYYLVGLALKVPLGTWGLALLALSMGLWGRSQALYQGSSPDSLQEQRVAANMNQVVVLAPSLAILALVSSQDGISRHFRYVLPVLPFAFVAISQAARYVGQGRMWSSVAVLALCGWSILSSMNVYPHSMAYFNELAGGASNGHRCMLGAALSWSQNQFYLKKWIEAHPNVDSPFMLLERSVSLERLGLRSRGGPPADHSKDLNERASSGGRIHGPVPGWHIVSVQRIHQPDGVYLYFLGFEPVTTIGYSIYIYHIEIDEANRIRRKMGLPELPQQRMRAKQFIGDMLAARRSAESLNVAVYVASQLNKSPGVAIQAALANAEGLGVTLVSEHDIRRDCLNKFDVLVVPGGKASVQGSALGVEGRIAIEDFVRGGGGYVGICAGAYLAAVNYDWSLKLVNARTMSGKRFVPGQGTVSASFRDWGGVTVELTDDGRQLLETRSRSFDVDYTGGPVFFRANQADLPDYVPLAYYRTEVWKYPFQKGTMVNTPAILAAKFGRGTVVVFSSHLETTRGGRRVLASAIRASTIPVGAGSRKYTVR